MKLISGFYRQKTLQKLVIGYRFLITNCTPAFRGIPSAPGTHHCAPARPHAQSALAQESRDAAQGRARPKPKLRQRLYVEIRPLWQAIATMGAKSSLVLINAQSSRCSPTWPKRAPPIERHDGWGSPLLYQMTPSLCSAASSSSNLEHAVVDTMPVERRQPAQPAHQLADAQPAPRDTQEYVPERALISAHRFRGFCSSHSAAPVERK